MVVEEERERVLPGFFCILCCLNRTEKRRGEKLSYNIKSE